MMTQPFENRDLEEKEVASLLREYLSWNPSFRPHAQVVAEKYDEFTQVLKGIKSNVAGEVMSAMAIKDELNQRTGEWLSNPVSLYTTGGRDAFGYRHDKAGGTKVIVNILLDGSESMSHADGAFETRAFGHQREQQPNDQGIQNPLLLAPRIFFASIVARYIRKSLMEAAKELQKSLEVNTYMYALGSYGETTEPYVGGVWLKHPNEGGGTPLNTIFNVLKKEEESSSYMRAAVLDLVITDGLFEEFLPHRGGSRRLVEQYQYERVMGGGSVCTVIMNMMPQDKYETTRKGWWNRVGAWEDEIEKDRNWSPPFSVMYHTESPQVLAQVFSLSLQDFFRRL